MATTTEERRAAALERRYRGYANHFALDWQMDANEGATAEPTDENLALVLRNCARPPRPEDYPHIRRHVMAARADLTADWLRGVVWGQATNPASKPVISAMADATAIHAWASLRILATALYDLESLTCGIDGSAARNVATRAREFARSTLGE